MTRPRRGHAQASALSGAAAVAAALCALAVTGCGGQTPLALPPTPPQQQQQQQQLAPADAALSGVHACSLIPKATVAALGQLDQPAAPSPDGLTCFYNLDGGPSYIVSIMPRTQYETTKTIDTSEAQAGLVQLTSKHGLGDEGFAISSDTGGPAYEVSAAKGGRAVEVTLDSVEPANEQRADQLVAAALARL